MPVGAGSIKRAAKAAEAIVTGTEGTLEKTVKDMSQTIPARKKSRAKSTDKKAEKNTGKKESESAGSRQKKESVKKTEKPAQRYEAYGIGQPLPVHLL